MDSALLAKAKELLKTPDMILDLYDFTIVWMSPRLKKILELSDDELVGKQLPNYFSVGDDKKREKSIEHMSKAHGFLTSDLKTKKGGVVRFEVEFYTIEFKGGFYHIGKGIKHSRIS
jgi:hypothetical protein